MVRYVDGLTESATTSTEQAQSNLKAMRTYIQDLSTQIPRTTEQISKMSAALGQSGIGADRQMSTGILRDTAVAATAMDLEDDMAGNYMAKWEAAFNFNHDQVMTLMDQINYLGANNATTAAEIAQSVNQAASMGQIAGVDPSATAAIATAMQATGVATDRVGTSISRIYTNISKGSNATKAQKAMWEELGFTAEGIARSMQSDGIGTLKSVFQAINNMPDERKVAALNTLFGQWAIEGGAKITQNLALLEKTLGEVNDPGLYTGSMEREFLIEASTPEAVDLMLSNAKTALMQDIGQAFLPAKKEFSLSMIDFLNQIRKNMPELTTLANSLGKIASDGVERLGDAMERALPYIQKGLDYLANNGPQVASTLGKLAAVFVGMKFAPGIESLLSGAGNLLLGGSVGGSGKRTGGLLGGIKSLFQGGQKAAGTAGGFLSTFGGAASGNGFFQTLGSVASSLISGNGIKGTAGLLEAAAGTPGLLSGYQGAGSALKNRIAGSGIGQYFGSVFSSLGNFGSTLGNTKTGGFLSGLLGKAGGALGNLTMPMRQGIAGIGAAATIQGSIIQQNLSGLLGKAGGFVSGIANSGAGKAIGGVLGSLGTVAKSGAGVLGTVWGPIASGFGSIFAGAAPVIGVISSIIAVVSILGDHLEDIRGIIQNVFGDTGVAVFDKFMGVLQNVGSFITGLFADGGVANALAPLRETITNLFGEDAGAAFDGLTTILQSVMGVVGQIVSFAQTTVKPIIQDIFSFLTGTVVPIILQTFTAAAPSIAGIISGLGSAIMTAMQIIGSAIQAVMPIVQSIITVIMSIASVVVPAVLAGISALAQGIGPILEGIKTVFDGLIAFITGVFTGNWSQAWEGVKQIFGGAFDALVGLLKTPVNAVIALINKAISGINGLGLDIPDWVPIIGGKSFHISIPEIPMLAKGGFTDGVSIAGEAGREAVISFQRGVRAQNIATWAQAGRMLGVSAEQALSAADGAELKAIDPGEGGGGGGNFTFAPNIVIQGNADADVLEEALRRAKEEFEAWYEQMMRKRARTAY
jgi:TP901 family phage tail tape measure protein